jgi:hypothetical protein
MLEFQRALPSARERGSIAPLVDGPPQVQLLHFAPKESFVVSGRTCSPSKDPVDLEELFRGRRYLAQT